MEDLKITVENKGEAGNRKLVVYNSSDQEYSFIPNKGDQGPVTTKEYNIPPAEQDQENYLMIAPAPGPGEAVGPCAVDIPLYPESTITITQTGIENMTITPSSEKTSLTIPLSPPTWQLTIARTPLVLVPRDPVGSGHGSHGLTASDPLETGVKLLSEPKKK
jgi:hypothetical protein